MGVGGEKWERDFAFAAAGGGGEGFFWGMAGFEEGAGLRLDMTDLDG